jgi:large subunit ribosomal protein L14
MIQERSVLKVADNSGAKVVRCFRVLGGSGRRYAGVGDIIVASVQSAEPRKTVKKKDVVKVMILRTKNALRRKDGSYVRFDENAVILVTINKENQVVPSSTRIFGPIPRELKEGGKRFALLIPMAEEIV